MKTDPALAMPNGKVDLAKIRAQMPQFGQQTSSEAGPSFAQAMGEGKKQAVAEAVRARMGLPKNTEGLAAARIASGSPLTTAQAALVVPDQPAAEWAKVTGGPLQPKAPDPHLLDGEQGPGERTGGPSHPQAHDPSLVEEHHGPVVRTGGPARHDTPLPPLADEKHGPAELAGRPSRGGPVSDRPHLTDGPGNPWITSSPWRAFASVDGGSLPLPFSRGRDG